MVVASFSGFFGACNEVFGIDPPQSRAEAGASGANAGNGASASASSGGASSSGRGGTTGGANGAGKGGAGTSGAASASGGGSRGGGTNGGSTNGGSTNDGGTNGGTGGSEAGTGDTGGSDAGSDQGGSSNGGSSNGGSTNGGSTNGGSGNGGVGGTAAGSGGTSAGTGGTNAGTSGSGPVDPCVGLSLPGPELVWIQAATGKIGADDIDTSPGDVGAAPEHDEYFGTYCIDKTEVTVAQYRACYDAGMCLLPDTTHSSCNWSTTVGSSRDDHPVTCMNQARARAYCLWAGKQLPDEKRWEFAARGPNGYRYPWGNTPEPETTNSTRLNWNNTVNDTKPVGSYPAGATLAGVMDMAGNAWEWTDSTWCSSWSSGATCDTSKPVARGGSWNSTNADFVRPAWRDPDSNGDRRFSFRCIYVP